MMTEQLRFFQVHTPEVDGMVNATEFRLADGAKRYAVTVIDETGHATIPLRSREDAIECADNYIRMFASRLAAAYNIG